MSESDQLGLWERSSPAENADVPSDLLSPLIRMGTSTWTYEGWQGLVYNKSYAPSRFKSECLAEYARYEYQGQRLFRTVGFDASFYGPPSSRQLAHYASQLPPGFQMCSKVWEDITLPVYRKHPRYGSVEGANPHFLSPDYFVERVLTPYRTALRDHTGPFILEFQRHLGLQPDEFFQRLDTFLKRLPREYEYAIELRDESLLTHDYHAILTAHGVSHVYNHWTSMPQLHEQHRLFNERFTAPFVLLRLLTPIGTKYTDAVKRYRPYDQIKEPLPHMRADTVTLITQATSEGRRSYALVNNRSEGSAPLTIHAIFGMLKNRSQLNG